MNKTWYKKTVLSYIPTLYLTIAIIVFISIFVINEISLKEAERANRYSTENIVHTLEYQLKAIERRMIEELRFGGVLYDFFEYNEQMDLRMVNYQVSNKVRQMINDHPMIHSIYLYRIRDDMVLAMNSFEPLELFEDKGFLLQLLSGDAGRNRWSPVRQVEDGNRFLRPPSHVRVISISQRAQMPLGREGLIVVNVSVDDLISSIRQMIDPNLSFLTITGLDETPVYSSSGGESENRKVMNRLSSDYLQMEFVSGVQPGLFFGWLKVISRIWIVLGVITIIVSLLYTIAITKRNYRPIERIVRQIQSYQSSRSALKGAEQDEFSYIQKALEKLVDQNVLYEKQVQEDRHIRRKQIFAQLVESDEVLSDKDWKDTIVRLDLPLSFDEGVVAVVEIDRYSEFEQKYNQHDQRLLKFALNNAAEGFFKHEHCRIWAEWNRMNRMTVILLNTGPYDKSLLTNIVESFRVWVAANLSFTITIGLGFSVKKWEDIRASCNSASGMLQYKLSLGRNRLLQYRLLPPEKEKDTHKYYQIINGIVQDFRIAKQEWTTDVNDLFMLLKDDLLVNDEILHLLDYFKSLMEKRFKELPYELQSYWSESVLPEWNRAVQKESLEEIAPLLSDLLKQMYLRYLDTVKSKNSAQLIHQIRQYIEENYANPDLSLSYISDKFNMNSKYASQLFKEQLGVNFVDFLMNLRIEQAKKLLLETNESINDIASLVGYAIPLSFTRSFKKIVGVAPSDYRKHMKTGLKE